MRWIFIALILALPAQAEEVVAGLSQSRVSITVSFEGSEILIFGAVKREEPIPSDRGRLEVVVTVAGPSVPVTVRRKAKRFGIWVNTDAVEIDAAPSFYKIATSGPFDEVMSQVEDLRHKVSIEKAIRLVGAPDDVANSESFKDALIRIRTRERAYQIQPHTVLVQEQTLFRTSLSLPANLTEGDYNARIFLTRDGHVIDQHTRTINVRKVGIERWIFKATFLE